MKKLDRLIPLAIDAAGENLAKNGKIPKEYNGYISSFGASARSGLKPAVAFFENKNADSMQDKTKLMKTVLGIICKYRQINPMPATLMEYVLTHQTDGFLKKDVMDAATALKLAIRTFDLDDGKVNKNG